MRAIFQVQAPAGAYIWKGDLTEGFLQYRFGGLTFGGAYIHGGAYFRNFTVLYVNGYNYFAYEFLDYPSTDITYSSSDETVTFGFSSPLPKGRGFLSMDFTGQLNDKLKGFYRSKYTGEDGSEKFCAATHFEVL